MISRKRLGVALIMFGVVALLYEAAVFLTFRSRSTGMEVGQLVAFSLTLAGGAASLALGYASVVILGGMLSLRFVELISRLNGSKHAIEIEEENEETHRKILGDPSLIYVPSLVFLIGLALLLNIHYLNSTFTVSFQAFPSPTLQGVLNELDIFLKPTSVGSLRYSVDIIPIMVSVVGLGGLVPSLVFPYLRKFKVSSFNAAPFHRDILFSVVGAVFGVTILLSMAEIFYGILVGTQPHYYSYALPAMMGFSLHYSLGIWAGRGKAESIVDKKLRSEPGARVFRGRVIIQPHQNTKP